jgi:hypothetical protein
MPRQRPVARSRSRGPWLARLAGLGVIVVVAGGGAGAYVAGFHPGGHHSAPLPTIVTTQQSVGLIAQSAAASSSGAPPGGLVQLLGDRGRPVFTPLSAAAANAQQTPPWVADLMEGGTYAFIFTPDYYCLAVGSHSRLVLQQCDKAARQQRWKRVNPALSSDGHDFYQYANLADGKCLSEVATAAGQVSAGLAACNAAQPPSQLLAFWWLSV